MREFCPATKAITIEHNIVFKEFDLALDLKWYSVPKMVQTFSTTTRVISAGLPGEERRTVRLIYVTGAGTTNVYASVCSKCKQESRDAGVKLPANLSATVDPRTGTSP